MNHTDIGISIINEQRYFFQLQISLGNTICIKKWLDMISINFNFSEYFAGTFLITWWVNCIGAHI